MTAPCTFNSRFHTDLETIFIFQLNNAYIWPIVYFCSLAKGKKYATNNVYGISFNLEG